MNRYILDEQVLHNGMALRQKLIYRFTPEPVDHINDLPATALHYGSRDRLYVWDSDPLYNNEPLTFRRMINRSIINKVFAKHERNYIDTPSIQHFIEIYNSVNWARVGSDLFIQPNRQTIVDLREAKRAHRPILQWVAHNGVIVSIFEDRSSWGSNTDFDFSLNTSIGKLHVLIHHPRYTANRWFSDVFIANTKNQIINHINYL